MMIRVLKWATISVAWSDVHALRVIKGAKDKRESHPGLSPQSFVNCQEAMNSIGIFLAAFCSLSSAQVNLDFSKGTLNPETGALCVMQEVCIPNLDALASQLPPGPCLADEGCNCSSDADCGGGSSR